MKVAVIGAGKVGSTAALFMILKDFADIVLVDVVEGLPQGYALDLMQASPLLGFEHTVVGCNDYRCMAGADIVIITAGLARKPGMTRLDLLKTNQKIVEGICDRIKECASKECIVIVVTNPVDVMCEVVRKRLGFPRERVIGMAGVLDSCRMSYFVANELDAARSSVKSLVLGTHGDQMVPLPRHTTVGGTPLIDLLTEEQIASIVDRTKNAGGEIVSYLKTGSAFFAPGASISAMVEAIAKRTNAVLPCSVYLEGEFGITGVYVGVPCVLGSRGLEKIIQPKLSPEELKLLKKSAEETRAAQQEAGI